MKKTNDYKIFAPIYSELKILGTGYLAFKNLPKIFKEYDVQKGTMLDFGCGAGRSTRFLKSIGFIPVGVDISRDMLMQAKHNDPSGMYHEIVDGKIPFANGSFDSIFSSLVFFEMPNKTVIREALHEIYRVLSDVGTFIMCTGSEEMYSHQWLSLDANFPENRTLKSGDVARITLKDINLTLIDYFWTHSDYSSLFEEVGFKVLNVDSPLGDDLDPYKWVSETEVSPYVTYVLKKKF